MTDNPLENDPEREARIRARAYRLWEEDGRPHGRDVEFWERARTLIGMEDSAGAGQVPNPTAPVAIRAPKRPARAAAKVEEASSQARTGEAPRPRGGRKT